MSKTFSQTLAELNAGAVARELDAALHDIVKAVSNTKSKGKLVLTIDIKPAKGGQTAVVEAGIKAQVPTFERAPDYFFFGRDGSLLRDHPDQKRLPLRDVASPDDVDPETGEIRNAGPVREVAAG
jgi:hypothetical protein